jgi:predicted metalloprotease
MNRSEPGPAPAPRPARRALAALAVAGAAVLGALGYAQLLRDGPPAPLPADRAEVIARRVGVVFDDTENVWRRTLRTEAGIAYGPAELVLYVREMPSPCAGAAFATGPFYCRAARSAGFDLAYFDELGARLRRQAEIGDALIVARVVAAHVQGELGVLDAAAVARRGAGARALEALEEALALHADCLTGVWAASAAGGLGPVPAGFYGELVRISRNVTRDRARAGLVGPPEADVFFAAGSIEAHEAAFKQGYDGGVLEACPPPEAAAG